MRARWLLPLVLALPSVARAETHDCIAESEAAQRDRTDGHLRKARDLFKACSTAECPESVRADCERSFDEVERATPTIVVIARANGRDVTDVRVIVDDEKITDRLDGHELAIDPGAHRLRLETAMGTVLGSREIIAHAAEKNRIIELAVSLPPPADARAEETHHTAGPWILLSIGAAIAIGGGVMLGVGESDIAHSRQGCITNTDGSLSCNPPTTTPDAQSRGDLNRTGTTLVDASVFALAGGGLVIVGGLLWHFLERPHRRSVAITPLYGPSFAGLTFDARF